MSDPVPPALRALVDAETKPIPGLPELDDKIVRLNKGRRATIVATLRAVAEELESQSRVLRVVDLGTTDLQAYALRKAAKGFLEAANAIEQEATHE